MIKADRVETAGEVADRLRQALRMGPADPLWAAPDGGLWATPCGVAVTKPRALVAGTRPVRAKLGLD